jgi:hypothetical protein
LWRGLLRIACSSESYGEFRGDFLSKTHIVMDFALDEAVWREAGRTFAEYAERRRQSEVVRRGGYWWIF